MKNVILRFKHIFLIKDTFITDYSLYNKIYITIYGYSKWLKRKHRGEKK